jgi:hypothetical protein
LDDARSTTFTVSLKGTTETEATGPHKFARPSLSGASAKRTTIPTTRLYCTSATNSPLKKADDPQCPSPTWRRFCESTIADKVMRNGRSTSLPSAPSPSRIPVSLYSCCQPVGAVAQFRERWVTRLDRAFQVPARRVGKSERRPLRARALSQLAARRAGAPWQRRATALALPEEAARRALEPRPAMARVLPMAPEGAERRNGARGRRVVMARTLPTARYDRASVDRAFQVPARRNGKSERRPLRARALSQLAARRAGAPWRRRAMALALPEAAVRRALEPRPAMARVLPMAPEGAERRDGARGQRVVMARTLPTARYDRVSGDGACGMAQALPAARVHSRS